MNKKINIFLLIATLMGLVSCNNSTDVNFHIEDVNLRYGESLELSTSLNKKEQEQIKYEFKGDNISIEQNVVTAKKPYTTTLVQATYHNYKTDFYVHVQYDTFKQNIYSNKGDNVFSLYDEDKFVKISEQEEYGYLYSMGEAVSGETFALSGTLEMKDSKDDGRCIIDFSNASTSNAKIVMRKNNDSNYSIYSSSTKQNSHETSFLTSSKIGLMNFFVIFSEKVVYFYIDELFVGKVVTDLNDAHIGFSSDKSKLVLSRINWTNNEEFIQKKLNETNEYFGKHFTGDAEHNTNIFRTLEDGSYLKRTYHYAQTFVYIEGKSLSGKDYESSGKIKMINPMNRGQIALLICKDDWNMVRVVLEHNNGNYHIFTDKKQFGQFNSYRHLGTSYQTISYRIVYQNGETSIYINNFLLAKVNEELGNTHFGIGGDRCQFTLSDIDGACF